VLDLDPGEPTIYKQGGIQAPSAPGQRLRGPSEQHGQAAPPPETTQRRPLGRRQDDQKMKKRVIKVVTTNSRVNVPRHQRHIVPVNTRAVNSSIRNVPAMMGLHSTNISNFSSAKTSGDSPRIAVLIHIYYNDLVPEMLKYLDMLEYDFDLYVSFASNAYPRETSTVSGNIELLKSKHPDAKVFVVENRGKDIGGKMLMMRHIIESNLDYDYAVFAHDKQSNHMKHRINANQWRAELLDAIFLPANVNRILNAFQSNLKMGMCGTRVRAGYINSRAISVNLGNYPLIQKTYAHYFGTLPATSAFIGGTMFWVKWPIYRSAFNVDNINKIYKQLETGDVTEPSITHAMERIFGIIVTSKGYKIGRL